MLWLYNIGIQLFGLIVRIFSLFNKKALLFIEGRDNIFDKIQTSLDSGKKHIWFHFASLGEFEQGRPVLEKIKQQYPTKSIVITFFSPSGYEVRKNYPLAEAVFYLPIDTAKNAEKLISAINPELVIFTKYEFWYHYFKRLNSLEIPLFIISAIFRRDQVFFKWYGGLHRTILSFVDFFFVQNEESKNLLASLGLQNTSVSGDTRFDRVAENTLAPNKIDLIEKFCKSSPVMIAGSTWMEDEQLLKYLILANPGWKFIIAPHEIDDKHIAEVQQMIPLATKYSTFEDQDQNSQVLIIDNIGLLSSIYQYGSIAYIGGGFGAGIHNTLEAAAFGLPVIFGPRYDKFQEAKDLIDLRAAISIEDQHELMDAFQKFSKDQTAGIISKDYVSAKKGSTDQIVQYLSRYL